MNSFQTPLSYQNIQKNTLNINAKVYESPKQYQKQQLFSPLPSQPSFQKGNIVEVYEDNFVKEIKRIGKFLNSYPYIGMDTEFPGTVYPCTSYTTDFYYQFTKANVDHLKLIQLGVTLFNKKGEYPPYISTWQFNLKYDYTKDEHSNQSISMLANCGINFEKLKNKGIPYDLFAEYFLVSGLILNDNVTWISFNGLSDFAYLLRLVLNDTLPKTEQKFEEVLNLYFPNVYDIKILVFDNHFLKGGLNKIAHELKLERTGEMHQAGSDSMLTGDVFFELLKLNYVSNEDLMNCKNILFGIGKGADDNETIAYTKFVDYNNGEGYE